MTRGIWTKWIFGGIVLLIIVAGVCVLWYRHDTATGRKTAAEADKQLQQSKVDKVKTPRTAKPESTQTPAENTTSTSEKPITDTTPVTKNTDPTQVQGDVSAQTAETVDVQVSPHGFGPYPEVPDDFPYPTVWEENPDSPSRAHELLDRVFVKLWTEGEKNFRGGSTHNGKIYPHYNDVVYRSWTEYRKNADGELVRRINGFKTGPHVYKKFKFTIADLYDPPPGLRVIDIDSAGINPYEYLNLR